MFFKFVLFQLEEWMGLYPRHIKRYELVWLLTFHHVFSAVVHV